jgi:hypothetical protein
MTPIIIIHEAAEAEINEAADFYDLENPGLGTVFIDEIQMAILKISRTQRLTNNYAVASDVCPSANFHIRCFSRFTLTKSGYWQ